MIFYVLLSSFFFMYFICMDWPIEATESTKYDDHSF